MERTKPSFDVGRTVTPLKVGDKVYDAQPIGRGNFHTLRAHNYGEGSRQVTFGEGFNLVHAGYMNPQSPEAKRIIEINRRLKTSGDTALYGGDKGSEWVFAQDFPEVKEGRIVMVQKDLVKRLESKGMIEINDNLRINPETGVSAMKREGFREGVYTVEQILESNQPIWITCDEQASRNMTDMMKITNKSVYLSIPSRGMVTVPSFFEFIDGLILGGENWDGSGGSRYSFAVRK